MDLRDEVTLRIIGLYDDVEEIGVSRTQARLMLREAVDNAARILDEADEDDAAAIVSMDASNAMLAKTLQLQRN